MIIRRPLTAAACLALAVALAIVGAPYWKAAMLIARAVEVTGPLESLASRSTHDVSDALLRIPVRTGSVRARIIRPRADVDRVALLVSGVHPDGIDDARLVALAEDLAATGIAVVTPEIDDLLHYRLTSQVTDTIEDVGRWMTSEPRRFGTSRLGLIGVSFSGGLSVVAAGRRQLRERVSYVLSFGGHGDLPRVLRYLTTGEGGSRPPHDYAVSIVLHQAAPLLVPAGQVAPLRHAIETFLRASTMTRTDGEDAARLFAEARALQAAMPEPSASLMEKVNARNVKALGAALLPYVGRLGQDPSLSPERSPAPLAPVYLLHGTGDNVIPAEESTRLAAYLRGRTRVRPLLTGFLTHVDVANRPGITDAWRMIAFWKDLLAER